MTAAHRVSSLLYCLAMVAIGVITRSWLLIAVVPCIYIGIWWSNARRLSSHSDKPEQ